MITRSALPTLALAALLTGLVPAPQARAEPEKPGVGPRVPPIVIPGGFSEHTLRAVVIERSRTLGPEHAETLAARRELADELRYQGLQTDSDDKLRENLEERRALLAIGERQHGAGDPATFDDWSALARAHLSLLELDPAEKEYRGVIAAMGKNLRPEDKDFLDTRADFALCLYCNGKNAEAEGELRALIALRERNPEVEGIGALTLRLSLAQFLEDTDRHADAEIEHRLVVAAFEKEEGAAGSQTLLARRALAKCLLRQGNVAEALPELEFVKSSWEKAVPARKADIETFNELLEGVKAALAKEEAETPAPAPAPAASGEGKAE